VKYGIITILIILTTIKEIVVYAQTPKLRFEHITTEQGLADNTVLSVMEDRKGFIWISTFNGLCKYDGYSFTTYQFDPDDSSSIGGNVITRVYEDKDGTIWVVARGSGIYLFDRSTEKFTRLKSKNDTIPSSISFSWGLNEDKEGKIWIGNDADGKLFRYDKQTGRISNENYTSNFFAKPDSNTKRIKVINCIYKDKAGTLWMGSNAGLHRLNLTPQQPGKISKVSFTTFRNDPKNQKSLPAHTISYNGIYQDKTGMLWVASYKGLCQLNPGTGECKLYIHDSTSPQSISDNKIRGMGEDKEGNLWIGTTNGLNKLNKERTIFTRYFHDDNDPASIRTNSIWSLFLDKKGILWLAFVGAGIDKVDLNQNPIALYQRIISNKNSLTSDSVTAVCEDRSGTVWIGTLGGLNAWDRTTNKFTHYRKNPKDSNSLGSDFVSAVIEDRDGNIWVGGGANAIGIFSRLNRKSGLFKHYFFKYPYRGTYGNPVLTLYEDKAGMLWIGTTGGAIRFNRNTETWVHYSYEPNNPNGIADSWVNSICEDRRGNFWIGHNSTALVKFNPSTGIFNRYIHNPNDPQSISSSIVKSIFRDSKDNLWFATRHGGLCRLNEENETFSRFTKKDGLPSNTIYSILEDDDHNLWLTTNKGLCRFNPSAHTFTNFDKDNGLLGSQFEIRPENAGGCFKGKDGTLYFGGPNGLNVFHPHDLTFNSVAPAVAITRFTLFNNPIPGKNEADEIILQHDENYFSFEFAALSFSNSAKNQYAYQLTGVDKDWVYSGTRRLASYTNIAPGHYVFRVKASNNDGVWNEKGIAVHIIILTPWWGSWWFYGLCAMVVAAIVYSLFKYRLQQKIKVLQIRNVLHRDLHDDVGATLSCVKAYSEILRDNPTNPVIADLIKDNSTEMLERLEVISWATNPQHDNFKSLYEKMNKFAQPLCHAHQVDFVFEKHGINDNIVIPADVRQNTFLVFKEAINNVIKYAKATECRSTLTTSNRKFILLVTDNGVGMDGIIRGNGSGIKNMKKRSEALKGCLEVENISPKGTSIKMVIHYPFKLPNTWYGNKNSK
jgi:ligand-binding sensor domain-containing protein